MARSLQPFRRGGLAVLMATALSTSLVSANAFYEADDAVTYRQHALSLMANNFSVMGDMLKGDREYDGEVFAARAADTAKLATIPWPAFSVEGAMPGNNSDALPEIWDNWEDFQARADALQTRTAALAEVAAGGDRDAISGAFREVAMTCKGCHDNYKD